jgi:hypothetical protein
MVTPLGPHQFMCALSVQAFQTSSRGASNAREMAKGRWADSEAGLFGSISCS